MSEESYNGAHFRTVVHPDFEHIGASIVLDPGKKRYIITIHFGNVAY